MSPTVSGGSVPVPDPTKITAEQIAGVKVDLQAQMRAADESQKDQFQRQMDSLRETIDLRNQKVDDAIAARNMIIEQLRAESLERVASLQALITERFNRVDAGFDNVANQFANRDTALNAALTATQTAANNALTATKEAVATAGLVTEKQITQQGKLQEEGMNGLRTSVIESQRRLDVLEGRTAGLGDASTATSDNTSLLLAVVAVMASITGVVIAIISLNTRNKHEPQPQPQPQMIYVDRPRSQSVPSPLTTTTTAG
jgi:hypothetical protein